MTENEISKIVFETGLKIMLLNFQSDVFKNGGNKNCK